MATRRIITVPESITGDLKLKGFKIHELPKTINSSSAGHGRRDFYKIGLVTGNMTLYYGDRLLKINDTVLFFVNPNIPHSVVRHSKVRNGYACLFTEAFMAGRERTEILKSSPLFSLDANPVIPLNKEQAVFMASLFQKMLSVHSSDYNYRNELIKNCIEMIIHEAIRIQPLHNGPKHKNAATRIASLFMELLERQFPVENTEEPLRLRTAQDFAGDLSVHVNYLNRAVKEVTGKPTSVHIRTVLLRKQRLFCYIPIGVWPILHTALGLNILPISTTTLNG